MSSPAIPQVANLDELYPILNNRRFTAGWHKARPSLWKEPVTPFSPQHWRYAEAASYMDQAGEWIGTDLAERRNLLMFNAVGDNDYASLPTLVAAYQMIKPGEAARAHRHTPNALRLVLDSKEDVYTVVDGVKVAMLPGDVLLTPSWTWHSHFNHSDSNAYWIDVLDVPLIHRMESMFFEPHPNEHQPIESSPEVTPMRFSTADQTRLLEQVAHDSHGHRMATLDTPSMRTMRLSVHELQSQGSIPATRSVQNRIYAVIEGSGEVKIGDREFSFERGDVFVAPMWHWHELRATSTTRLLEVSDEPVHHMLGIFRQEAR